MKGYIRPLTVDGARTRRDRPGLTSNANYFRILREMAAGPRKIPEVVKSAGDGRTLSFIVREGLAEYIFPHGEWRASHVALTAPGMAFLLCPPPITEPLR